MASGDTNCSQKSSGDLLNVGDHPTGVESLLLLKKGAPAPVGPEQRATYRVPTSSVLDRVRAFLPRMRESETALQERLASEGADAVCIEADDSARPHIELNLGLCELESGSDSDSESDCESAASDAEDAAAAPVGPVTAANLRLPGGGGGSVRRLVTELGQSQPAPASDERHGQ